MAFVYKRTITAYQPGDVCKLKTRLGGDPQKTLTLTVEALENSDLKRCSVEQYASSLKADEDACATQAKFSWVEHTYLTADGYNEVTYWRPGGFGASGCFFENVLIEQAKVCVPFHSREGFKAAVRFTDWSRSKIVRSEKLEITISAFICPFVMKYEVAEVDDSRIKWTLAPRYMTEIYGFYPDITINLLCPDEELREIPLYNSRMHPQSKAICIDFEGLEFKPYGKKPIGIGYFSENIR